LKLEEIDVKFMKFGNVETNDVEFMKIDLKSANWCQNLENCRKNWK